ncbi:isocitrate lyase/phosphoenolpyruvate mutase family protein [Halalkalibacterium halodurans]|uniref:isocitrate lyase/phosphoenolpyruvate mutase family protein n=1 Tax=Halalkalibacterium halodurans TaxID=86665 RepID=UPI002E1CEB2E|nr:isocitrate lyase/phosphoenolpyruvate mutase family protein [Halalkalibacterium halodurans]
MTKLKQMRNLIKEKELILTAGAHDAISAQLAEEAGFDAIWASGLGISATHGVPDASILTMTEFLNSTSIINNSVSLPVIADCDSGFGNVHNVVHMIKTYEAAGIAGVCIEDKVFPKRNSFVNSKQTLEEIGEFSIKIKAAKEAQQNEEFIVIARTEALISGLGVNEALERAYSYEDAGADMILIHSKKSTSEEIKEFASKWKGEAPLVIVPTKYPNITFDEIISMRIKMSIYANQSLRASIQSMSDIYNQIINDQSTRKIEHKISSIKKVFQLQGMDNLEKNDKKYTYVQS